MSASDEIMRKLTAVFIDVLDDEDIILTNETTAADVDGWDSLTHIRIMLTVERAFSLKFSGVEIGKLKNVGDLVQLIQQHGG